MSKLEYYMNLNYKMVIEKDDNGTFLLYFPELPGCITSGHTAEEAIRNAEDAKREWFTACLESNVTIPFPTEKMVALS